LQMTFARTTSTKYFGTVAHFYKGRGDCLSQWD
jgi:hypothetical protein